MKAFSTVFRYNQGNPYKVQAVYEIWSGLKNGNYAGDEYIRQKYLKSQTAQSANNWIQAVKNDCSAIPKFTDCLLIVSRKRLSGDPFYLKHIAQHLSANSSPFGSSYEDSILSQKLISANSSAIILSLRSPAELRVVDFEGHITGLVNGEIKEEIPNTFYDADNESLVIFNFHNDYKFQIVGEQQGEYGFSAHAVNGDDLNIFNATDIPITNNEIHTYTVDWQALANGEKGVMLQIDTNGDGITDRIIHSGQELNDITPPQINAPNLSSEYLFNSSLQLQFSATDDKSGIANITATLNGNPVINNQTVILNKPDVNVFQIIAIDNAGNISTSTQQFKVVYNFGGFQPPIKIDGSGVYKLGRALPIKFQLFDVNSSLISSAMAKLSVLKISNSVVSALAEVFSVSAADKGNTFRYDPLNNQYIFNLDTSRLSVGIWNLQIVLDDGNGYNINMSIRN